jgi:formate C-acetyltransferase
MGGFALSFNVVSPETLIDAQKHPEQYKDLLVRVHGYSAHFITLSREYQNLIIERAGGFTKSTAAERDFRE